MNSTDLEWNADFDPLGTPELAFTFIWGVEAIFGVLCNGFVVYVVPFAITSRTILDVFIFLLAVSDFISNSSVIVVAWTNGISGGWKVRGLCSLNVGMMAACGTFNLLMLCVIARHRYLTVVYQQKASKMSLALTLLLVLAFSVLFGVLQPLDLANVSIQPSGTVCLYNWWDKGQQITSFIFGVVLFSFAYSLMGYYYYQIAKAFQRSSDNIRHLLRGHASVALPQGVGDAGVTKIVVGECFNVKTNQVAPLSPPVPMEISRNDSPAVLFPAPVKLSVAASSTSGLSLSSASTVLQPDRTDEQTTLTVKLVDGISESPQPSKENEQVATVDKAQGKTMDLDKEKAEARIHLAPAKPISSPPSSTPRLIISPRQTISFVITSSNVSTVAASDFQTVSASQRRLEMERMLTLKTFSLMVAFLACWLLYSTLIFYEFISAEPVNLYYDGVANLLAAAGLSVNPVLYCFLDTRYRNALKRLIKISSRRVDERQKQEEEPRVEPVSPMF